MKAFRLWRTFFRNASKESCNSFLYSSLANDSVRDLSEYLTTVRGFPSEEAAKICQRVKCRSPSVEKIERVVGFLSESGISDAQIRKAIARNPQLLGLKVEKTLVPKMKAFQDWGLSAHEIATIVERNPFIFNSSLENVLAPTVGVLKTVLPSDKNLGSAIKSLFSRVGIVLKVETLQTHLSMLRSLGVPHSSIWRMLVSYPSIFRYDPSSLETTIEKAHQFGFGYSSTMFPAALATLSGFKESKWNSKVDVLKGFGWSDENLMEAFQKAPLCLAFSTSRLQRKLDYFANELNVTASALATSPYLLTFSLEKRVIPRLAVMRKLECSEIVERRKWSLVTILTCSEKRFCENYVFKYMNQCPEVVQMYRNSEKKSHDDHTEN